MAKYISIPTTAATGVPNITFNTDLITSIVYTNATTFAILGFGKSYTFTTTGNGAQGMVTNINTAIAAINGPLLTQVILPTGITVAALPVVA